MHINKHILVWLVVFLSIQAAFSQTNRITYNDQQLFLNGANLAWASFANDVGTGNPDTTAFKDILTAMNSSGGNAMRWWLHTDGTASPEFDGTNHVISPGAYTISDIRKVLDIAWQREIGVILCLWSFDMLKTDKAANVQTRNLLLLNDTSYARSYINNCLIPMVDSLKDHPALLSWEIFNEPEGMSNEFGWTGVNHVPMAYISRFVNLSAGAIHREDSTALVTSGAWSFYALVDAPILAKASASAQPLTYEQKLQDAKAFIHKNRLSGTPEEMVLRLQKIAGYAGQKNYYSDSMLIAQGGDSAGVLDFYSVHFYGSGTSTSPFHNASTYWNLTKPIVAAEFAMESGQGSPTGVPVGDIYTRLYNYGYAGALGWSWSDQQISSQAHMLAGMLSMWNAHQSDVNVNGISGQWPSILITSPAGNAIFLDTTSIPITVGVSDIDSQVDSVEFYANDTIKIGVSKSMPFSNAWLNARSGNYKLTAVAIDHQGHVRTSTKVPITVGVPSTVRLEAETAIRVGTMSVVNDATASGGKYVNLQNNDPASTITWTFTNNSTAGVYPIIFGYKLGNGTPKSQFINVNGVRVDTLVCSDPSTTTWYEQTLDLYLQAGADTVQMQMFWGYMYVDYIAVPRSVATSVDDQDYIPASFTLEQNYPNPFNPITNIRYSVAQSGLVKLIIYDILGRQIRTLVNKRQDAGVHETSFDASFLPSGVYFLRMQADDFIKTRKMVLLK
jgi:hypothetical protein